MKDFPIQNFGTKLMAASRSVNNIPDHFLSYSRNARIFDGGIGPRRGKRLLASSTIGTKNQGGFTMNGKLYQIANSNIYEVDLTTGTQTSKGSLGFDARCDSLVYQFTESSFSSLGSGSQAYSYVSLNVARVSYDRTLNQLMLLDAVGTVIDFFSLPYDPRSGINATLNILVTTTNYSVSGTGTVAPDGTYYLSDGQYMQMSASSLSGTVYFKVGNIIYSQGNQALIASSGQPLSVFNGSSVFIPNTVPANDGMLEYCRGFTFLASGNVLYISRPISIDHKAYAYDFIGTGSQTITYDTSIKGLKSTMNGLYVFTEDKVEFLGANALQNVAGGATFISTPLGDAASPINGQCITAAGDKIFWISQNLQVMTVNVIPGVTSSVIGELSARPVVSIKEFLDKLDTNQPYSFAFFNQTDKTAQFHVRTALNPFNDYVLVYDMVNDTWNVDTQKQYNCVIKLGYDYYGLSDVNSSVYQDDTGYSDAGMPIEFHVITQNMIQGTYNQKLYGGMFTMGAIGRFTTLDYEADIDGEVVFADSITGGTSDIPPIGEIGGNSVGAEPTGGGLTYASDRVPFDLLADEGRIFQAGTRIRIDISSTSQIQDFIIDRVGTRADIHNFVDTSKKW